MKNSKLIAKNSFKHTKIYEKIVKKPFQIDGIKIMNEDELRDCLVLVIAFNIFQEIFSLIA